MKAGVISLGWRLGENAISANGFYVSD